MRAGLHFLQQLQDLLDVLFGLMNTRLPSLCFGIRLVSIGLRLAHCICHIVQLLFIQLIRRILTPSVSFQVGIRALIDYCADHPRVHAGQRLCRRPGADILACADTPACKYQMTWPVGRPVKAGLCLAGRIHRRRSDGFRVDDVRLRPGITFGAVSCSAYPPRVGQGLCRRPGTDAPARADILRAINAERCRRPGKRLGLRGKNEACYQNSGGKSAHLTTPVRFAVALGSRSSFPDVFAQKRK